MYTIKVRDAFQYAAFIIRIRFSTELIVNDAYKLFIS